MRETRIITAIDVGTTKVCTIIGRGTGPGDMEVLAHSIVPSAGLKKGNVTDVSASERAIRTSIRDAESKAGVKIQSAYVGVTGAHVSFVNRSDELDWVSKHGVVTSDELARVPGAVASSGAEPERTVIHALPMTYTIDDQKGIRNPVGMHTGNLKVESHVVTGASSFIDKLVEAVENTGVRVEGLVLEPLASGEAVLTSTEMEQGAAIVDIGGGTTDVVVFKNGVVNYTAVIPVGGYQFTNDICLTYNTPFDAAESAKIAYAHTQPYVAGSNEDIALPVIGRTTELRLPRRDLCQLTRERAQELARLIRLKLQEAHIGDLARVRLVLTGGSSNLPGLEALMQQTVTNRVRIGIPNGHVPIPDELRAPAYSTSVGILLWGMNQTSPAKSRSVSNGADPRNSIGSWVSRLVEPLSRIFSEGLFSTRRGRA